ncbi:sensor histidine kinase [Rubrobacter calidifluminis]|uniref:sensor histidine kinase n=1 Tax=Rubrobacter calidifluminis TaxID=1392640 RepID=UPI002362BB9A|nr:ATP-binding protein [Rubrobacter calidifluminis]
MFFGRKRARKKEGAPRRKGAGWPRVGIRAWLTALFVLVAAFAGATAYEVVKPILAETLYRASQANFQQVGEQFQREIQRNPHFDYSRLQNFAASHDVQWGIVQNGKQVAGNLSEGWNPTTVREAIKTRRPQQSPPHTIQLGVRKGQEVYTYAVPAQGKDKAIVFLKFYAQSDILNADAALGNIQRLAMIAGILALVITGLAGYIAADMIARRVTRLGIAADRLAAGNFSERIETTLKDEVGDLGATFNAMASSLEGAFRQVEQEKERSKAILDGMTDAVIGVDADLNATFLNPRARELLESSGREFHSRLQEILAESRERGPITSEVEAKGKVIEVRAAPLDDGALAIMRDITEQRQVERAKAEFIANASHELKTPIFALSGYLEMLEDEEDEEVRQAFLKDMRSQTERLQNLARTLLDLSRIDSGALTFRTEEVDLEEILYELRRDFSYAGREINVEVEEGMPPVETDPTQLHRTLAILVDNAIKYSEGNSPVELALKREDGHAVISVKDYGCGIPESEQQHIFDRFYRAQGSSRADGTGLGLALAREIIDHLGGEITVRSRPEQGSTFSVSLPMQDRVESKERKVS